MTSLQQAFPGPIETAEKPKLRDVIKKQTEFRGTPDTLPETPDSILDDSYTEREGTHVQVICAGNTDFSSIDDSTSEIMGRKLQVDLNLDMNAEDSFENMNDEESFQTRDSPVLKKHTKRRMLDAILTIARTPTPKKAAKEGNFAKKQDFFNALLDFADTPSPSKQNNSIDSNEDGVVNEMSPCDLCSVEDCADEEEDHDEANALEAYREAVQDYRVTMQEFEDEMVALMDEFNVSMQLPADEDIETNVENDNYKFAEEGYSNHQSPLCVGTKRISKEEVLMVSLIDNISSEGVEDSPLPRIEPRCSCDKQTNSPLVIEMNVPCESSAHLSEEKSAIPTSPNDSSKMELIQVEIMDNQQAMNDTMNDRASYPEPHDEVLIMNTNSYVNEGESASGDDGTISPALSHTASFEVESPSILIDKDCAVHSSAEIFVLNDTAIFSERNAQQDPDGFTPDNEASDLSAEKSSVQHEEDISTSDVDDLSSSDDSADVNEVDNAMPIIEHAQLPDIDDFSSSDDSTNMSAAEDTMSIREHALLSDVDDFSGSDDTSVVNTVESTASNIELSPLPDVDDFSSSDDSADTNAVDNAMPILENKLSSDVEECSGVHDISYISIVVDTPITENESADDYLKFDQESYPVCETKMTTNDNENDSIGDSLMAADENEKLPFSSNERHESVSYSTHFDEKCAKQHSICKANVESDVDTCLSSKSTPRTNGAKPYEESTTVPSLTTGDETILIWLQTSPKKILSCSKFVSTATFFPASPTIDDEYDEVTATTKNRMAHAAVDTGLVTMVHDSPTEVEITTNVLTDPELKHSSGKDNILTSSLKNRSRSIETMTSDIGFEVDILSKISNESDEIEVTATNSLDYPNSEVQICITNQSRESVGTKEEKSTYQGSPETRKWDIDCNTLSKRTPKEVIRTPQSANSTPLLGCNIELESPEDIYSNALDKFNTSFEVAEENDVLSAFQSPSKSEVGIVPCETSPSGQPFLVSLEAFTEEKENIPFSQLERLKIIRSGQYSGSEDRSTDSPQNSLTPNLFDIEVKRQNQTARNTNAADLLSPNLFDREMKLQEQSRFASIGNRTVVADGRDRRKQNIMEDVEKLNFGPELTQEIIKSMEKEDIPPQRTESPCHGVHDVYTDFDEASDVSSLGNGSVMSSGFGGPKLKKGHPTALSAAIESLVGKPQRLNSLGTASSTCLETRFLNQNFKESLGIPQINEYDQHSVSLCKTPVKSNSAKSKDTSPLEISRTEQSPTRSLNERRQRYFIEPPRLDSRKGTRKWGGRERRLKDDSSAVDVDILSDFNKLKGLVEKADKEAIIKQTMKSRAESVMDNVQNESLLRNYEEINRLENGRRWKEKMKRLHKDEEDNNVARNSQSFDLNSSTDWFVNFNSVGEAGTGGNEAYSSLLKNNEAAENSDAIGQKKEMYDCPQEIALQKSLEKGKKRRKKIMKKVAKLLRGKSRKKGKGDEGSLGIRSLTSGTIATKGTKKKRFKLLSSLRPKAKKGCGAASTPSNDSAISNLNDSIVQETFEIIGEMDEEELRKLDISISGSEFSVISEAISQASYAHLN